MRWSRAVIVFLAAFAALRAEGSSEIAVAIRYLQAEGTSHAQIFLYREDGTLLRQLTHEKSGQMKNPVFAADGGTIVCTREMPSGGKDYWSVEPQGSNLRKLDAAPAWYTGAKDSPYFTDAEPEPAAGVSPTPEPSPEPTASPSGDPLIAPPGPDHYVTPDGTQEILLKVSGDDDTMDQPGRGKHYELMDVKSGKSVELGSVPGFLGLFELLHLNSDAGVLFLMSPPMRLAFFDLHLDSTNGDTDFALDLDGPRLVRLSDNWAAPVPLPGEPAFLTYTEARYLPIPGSKMTANCSYVEHWDAGLNKVRYARAAPAVCYGASMYRAGMEPVTVNILSESE